MKLTLNLERKLSAFKAQIRKEEIERKMWSKITAKASNLSKYSKSGIKRETFVFFLKESISWQSLDDFYMQQINEFII